MREPFTSCEDLTYLAKQNLQINSDVNMSDRAILVEGSNIVEMGVIQTPNYLHFQIFSMKKVRN